jgi:hypothetical protein
MVDAVKGKTEWFLRKVCEDRWRSRVVVVLRGGRDAGVLEGQVCTQAMDIVHAAVAECEEAWRKWPGADGFSVEQRKMAVGSVHWKLSRGFCSPRRMSRCAKFAQAGGTCGDDVLLWNSELCTDLRGRLYWSAMQGDDRESLCGKKLERVTHRMARARDAGVDKDEV